MKGSSSSGASSSSSSNAAATGDCNHLNIPLANTEVSYVLGVVKKFTISSQLNGVVKVSYASGGDFLTVPRGATYSEDGLNTGSGFTLYFQSSIANDIIEIVTWV